MLRASRVENVSVGDRAWPSAAVLLLLSSWKLWRLIVLATAKQMTDQGKSAQGCLQKRVELLTPLISLLKFCLVATAGALQAPGTRRTYFACATSHVRS